MSNYAHAESNSVGKLGFNTPPLTTPICFAFFGEWVSGDHKTPVLTIGTAAGQQGGSDAPISQNSPAMRRSASRQSGSSVCSFGACCEQPL